MRSLLFAKKKGKLWVGHAPLSPAPLGTKGWPRGGQGTSEGPRVLQNTPYLLGSGLSASTRSFLTLVRPEKLSVQDVACCLLLSQKFTSRFFIL